MIAFDASVLFGGIDRRGNVAERSRRVFDAASPKVTTEACVTEAMYLSGNRFRWSGQERVWAILRFYEIQIVPVDIEMTERLMSRYRDVPMDFADATLVALASSDFRLKVATFDSDFLAYRRDDGSPVPLVEDRLLGWQ